MCGAPAPVSLSLLAGMPPRAGTPPADFPSKIALLACSCLDRLPAATGSAGMLPQGRTAGCSHAAALAALLPSLSAVRPSLSLKHMGLM